MALVDNYVPGDWPVIWQATEQGEVDQTEIDANFPDDIDGSEFGWVAATAAAEVGSPSMVTPNIANLQETKTPYVTYHLFP